MKFGASFLVVAALALAGCGGGSSHQDQAGTTTGTTTAVGPGQGSATEKLPPGAVEPPDRSEEAGGPAATEASPEAPAGGPQSKGELPSGDRSAVGIVVSEYIAALDRHDAAGVCALLAPGSLDLADLPKAHGGCRPSLQASIGARPRSGGPAWRRSTLVAVETEDLGEGRARASATVTHRFYDRKYISVEDDVIYLERTGARWRLAKPSGTLYRAVGYPEPPLRALSPPSGW